MKFFTKDAGTLAAWAGVIIAALGIWLTLIQFIEQRKQFEESINVQNRQFLQQEKRLQRQRYTELVGILWSDKDGKPTYNEKLRAEALKEFLETEWLSSLNLSTTLVDANLQNIVLNNVNWQGGDFNTANMSSIAIHNSNLSNTFFANSKLNSSTIEDSDFTNSNFINTKFNKASLFRVNFTGADLSFADFSELNMSKVFIGHINFTGARLSSTNFQNANLYSSDLTGISMCFGIWYGANLAEANLKNAKLKCNDTNADLRGVKNLTCQQLKESIDWQYAYRDEKLACGADIPD